MLFKLIVDPPMGHRYGYPRVMPDDVVDVEAWFAANGYPQTLIDQGMLKYYRAWYQEFEEKNDE